MADNRLGRVLDEILDGAEVRTEPGTLDGSVLALVDGGQGTSILRARWVGTGWPADTREILEQLAPEGEWPRDLVLIARRFSSGARDLLTDAGANWADETGAARIVAPGLLVLRDGSARDVTRRRPGWSASAIDLAELLLSQAWPEGFGTTELANRSGWSPPQVSQVLQGFDEQEWTSKYGPGRGRGAKRELVDPDGLLESWSEAVGGQEVRRRQASRTVGDPLAFLAEELAGSLDEHVRWALGGWAAAQEVAPFVTAVPTLQIHVHEDDFRAPLEEAMRRSGLREVQEGGRVQFLSAAPELIARSWSRGSFPLASTPRIYVDLRALGPRGAEAAGHLKEEAIDPLHRRGQVVEGPSQGLVVWERETKARLRDRMRTSPVDGIEDRYRHGTYSASYRLRGIESRPTLPQFKAILQEVVGHETGWPAWRVPEGSRSYEETIETWFEDTVFNDPAHSDFWRADPRGRMCLVRGYDEDGARAPVPAGATVDLTLPVWRVGECLLHAGRLGARLGAMRVEFMMRWEGLEGRVLTSYANQMRSLVGEYRCHQDLVVTDLETTPAAIEPELPGLVERLVAPLYAAFDFFEAPPGLFDEELGRMRARVPR